MRDDLLSQDILACLRDNPSVLGFGDLARTLNASQPLPAHRSHARIKRCAWLLIDAGQVAIDTHWRLVLTR